MLPQKLRLLVLFILISASGFAQDPYEPFARAFGENYSNQDYEAIYNLCSDGFKSKVPKDYFSQILTATYENSGKLNEIKLSENTATGKIFHVVCEKATFALSVSLDAAGKAAGLFIRPVQKYDGKNDVAIIEQWLANPANAGLIVCRVRNGRPDMQIYGVANKAAAATLDEYSIFEIGSISKALTGIILHTMIAEGKISLDDPANKFLPEGSYLPKVKGQDILIRHLVTHSSCLPRMPGNFNPPQAELANPYNYYSPKELLAFLPQVTPGECELGKTPEYSNLGAGLVGYILTKISGKTYSELFNERIAKPLKTKSLGVMGASDKWVAGHTPSGAPQPQWTFTDAIVGAGGVDASAADMLKLLLFLMNPDHSSLGKAVTASTAVQLPATGMAFGTFWVRNTHESKTLIWHNGMTGGFNAFIGWVEGTQTGVFILTNNGEDVATSLGMTIMTEEK